MPSVTTPRKRRTGVRYKIVRRALDVRDPFGSDRVPSRLLVPTMRHHRTP
jgi:hypothetical protein